MVKDRKGLGFGGKGLAGQCYNFAMDEDFGYWFAKVSSGFKGLQRACVGLGNISSELNGSVFKLE